MKHDKLPIDLPDHGDDDPTGLRTFQGFTIGGAISLAIWVAFFVLVYVVTP